MPHELLLTTRQKTKIRNVFSKIIATGVKLSKSQLSKIIQWGRFIGKTLDNLGKKPLLDLAVPLAKDVLPKLRTNLTNKTTLSILEWVQKNK